MHVTKAFTICRPDRATSRALSKERLFMSLSFNEARALLLEDKLPARVVLAGNPLRLLPALHDKKTAASKLFNEDMLLLLCRVQKDSEGEEEGENVLAAKVEKGGASKLHVEFAIVTNVLS